MMANAEQYAQWIIDNKDKQGTPEFDTVAAAYRAARGAPAPVATPPAPTKEAPMSLMDTALSAAQGAVGATKSTIEGITGAGSGIGETLEGANKWLAEKMSPERKAEIQRRAQAERAAAGTGVLNEVATGLGGVKEAPVQTVAQGIGSSAPAILAGVGAAALGSTLGAPVALAAAVGIGAKYLLGAIQGAGEVKGTIYDAVKEKLEANGVSPDAAKKQASAAQDYLGANWDTIAQGMGLGALAGGTGVEHELLKTFSKPIAKRLAAKEAEKAGVKVAEKGAIRQYSEAGLKEGLGEGAQGGQQQAAENVALSRAGYQTDTMKGVYGAAARDAAMGALTGSAAHSIAGSPAAKEAPPAQLPPEAPTGTQGVLFQGEQTKPALQEPEAEPAVSAADMLAERDALRAQEPTPETQARIDELTIALTKPDASQDALGLDFQREYADLVKERERLRAQEPTPAIEARIADLSEQIQSFNEMDIAERRAQSEQDAEQTKLDAEAAAKFPALATAPDLLSQSDEVKSRLQGELFPGEDLGTKPEAPVAEPTLRSKKETGPKQLPLGLRRNPEGQPTTFGEPEPTFTSEDVMLTAVPVRKGMESWIDKNIIGSTRTQLLQLIESDPTLIEGKDQRAKLLRALTLADVPAFEESKNVKPTTSKAAPTEQRAESRASEPSVAVPSEPEPAPAGTTTSEEPVAPDGRGLVPAGQPAVQGTETQGSQPTAVETADEEAARKAEAADFARRLADVEKADQTRRAAPAVREASAAPAKTEAPTGAQRYDIDSDYASKGWKSPFDVLKSKERSSVRKTAAGQSLESLQNEIASGKGALAESLRRMVRSGKVKLEESHPSGNKGGLFDGRTVTLYAQGIPSGDAMSVALHEVGAHMGLTKLLGQNQYDALINTLLDWIELNDNSPQAKLAQAAYRRIPIKDIKNPDPAVARDEMVAYFVEEVAKAEALGKLPKQGPLRILWNRIKTAMLSSLNKALGKSFGIKDLTPQQVSMLAQTAMIKESKTGVAGGASPANERSSVPNPTLLQQSAQLVPASRSVIQSLQAAAAAAAGKNSTVSLATRIRTALVDPLASVEQRLTKDYDQGVTDAMGNTSATIVARQAQDVTKLMQAFYEDGALVVDPRTRMLEVQKGTHAPDDIFPVIHDLAKDLGLPFEEAFAYASTVMEGMKLQELVNANQSGATDVLIHWRTANNAIDTAKIGAAVAEYNADPRYKKLADIMDAPRIGLINELEKAGRITPEMAKEWRDVAHYVPYDRMDDFAKTFSGAKRVSSKGLARVGRLPQLVGSEWRPVGNVFENYFKTMGWMASQLAKQNANSYMMGSMVNAGYATKLADPSMSRTGLTVPVYIKGEERYYEVPSKWDQMAFIDSNGPMPRWVKFLGQVSGVLRTAITANPVFAASQVVQDVQGALLFSGVKNPLAFISASLGNFGTLAWHETVNAYKAARGEATTTHKIEQDMRRLGLSGEVDYTASNPAMEELFRQGVRKRTKLGSTTLGAIIHGLEQITHSSDLAVRKALYDDEMRQSNDRLLASSKAREMINFRRRGSNEWVQHWVTMVPFFNAALQSTDIVYRAVTSKADPSGLAKQAARTQFKRNLAIYGSAVLMYSVLRGGDDDYEKMDRRVRDNNWVLPGNVRIPIRGDMAVVKVAIENGMDYLRRQGTTEELEAMEAVKTAYQYAFEQYVGRNARLPAALQPLFENFANFSFMTGRAQVGTYQQSKPKHLQETAGTTETAKAIADFVHKQFNGMEISPVHIDNVLRGYLGTTAATATMLTDAAIYPDKLDRPLHRLTAIGAFAWDESQLTNPKNEFYALQEKVLPPVRALNEMKVSDPAGAEKYADEHQTELMLASTINHTLEQLSRLRAYEKYLKGPEAAREMPAGAREEEMANTLKYANEIVGYVRQLRHELKI